MRGAGGDQERIPQRLPQRQNVLQRRLHVDHVARRQIEQMRRKGAVVDTIQAKFKPRTRDRSGSDRVRPRNGPGIHGIGERYELPWDEI